MLAERSEIEGFTDRKCRLARDGGWFSYALKCNTDESLSLVVTYWGGVWHKRVFDILLDGRPVASEELLANRPGEFFDQVYPLPASATAGRARVTVRFQSRPNAIAGGVFGVKPMLSRSAPQPYRQPAVFKDH